MHVRNCLIDKATLEICPACETESLIRKLSKIPFGKGELAIPGGWDWYNIIPKREKKKKKLISKIILDFGCRIYDDRERKNESLSQGLPLLLQSWHILRALFPQPRSVVFLKNIFCLLKQYFDKNYFLITGYYNIYYFS